VDLDEAADALYALPRDEFTAARDARVVEARTSGDKALVTALRRLRRPTVAAWLVNRMARRRPEDLAELTTLGESLRAAHQQLDGAALRRLSERRRELVTALARGVRELGEEAGEAVSDAVSRELEGMFAAALADPDAARALVSGRLSSPRELDDAATLNWPATAPGARPRPAPPPPDPAPNAPEPNAPEPNGPGPGRPGPTTAGRPAPRPAHIPSSAPPPGPTATPSPATEPAAAMAPATGPSAAARRARDEVDRLAEALRRARDHAADMQRDHEQAAAAESAAHRAVAERRAELIAAEEAERRARQTARAARRGSEDAERALREADRRHALARDRHSALED
jgi:hypothetical protein